MKIFSVILLLTAATVCAEDRGTRFRHPDGFPVTMKLVIPDKDAGIISQGTKDGWDTITAHLEDDRGAGLLLEAVDASGKMVWRHDFGYNASAAPGCSVSVSHHPRLPALIVKYEGYKWDWKAELLFIKESSTGPQVSEYDADEFSAFLEKQPGYPPPHRYLITPIRFSGDDIVFSCIPASTGNDPHPFALDLPWFEIKAGIDASFRVSPMSATVVYR